MIYTILLILTTHFVGDFVVQTNEMAINKSISIKWLTIHVLTYTAVLTLFALIYFGFVTAVYKWIALNALLHWFIDYFTSKGTARLKVQGKIHEYFVLIGADQLLHQVCLLVTYIYFFDGRL